VVSDRDAPGDVKRGRQQRQEVQRNNSARKDANLRPVDQQRQAPGISAGVVAFPHPEGLRPEDLFTQVEAAPERGKKSEPSRIGVAGKTDA